MRTPYPDTAPQVAKSLHCRVLLIGRSSWSQSAARVSPLHNMEGPPPLVLTTSHPRISNHSRNLEDERSMDGRSEPLDRQHPGRCGNLTRNSSSRTRLVPYSQRKGRVTLGPTSRSHRAPGKDVFPSIPAPEAIPYINHSNHPGDENEDRHGRVVVGS